MAKDRSREATVKVVVGRGDDDLRKVLRIEVAADGSGHGNRKVLAELGPGETVEVEAGAYRHVLHLTGQWTEIAKGEEALQVLRGIEEPAPEVVTAIRLLEGRPPG